VKTKANYITCQRGHKVFVIWDPQLKVFGFTCDVCDVHMLQAMSIEGLVKIVRVDEGEPRGIV